MEAADANGGNAEVTREEPNLETPVEMPEPQDEPVENSSTSVKMEESSEVNGDLKSPKKKSTPVFRRKLRKFKVNSTGNVESDTKPHTRGQKRKLSEVDDASSEDSTEFNGFDTQVMDTTESGSHVLQKLIAEAESAESPQTKRRRRSTSKGMTKNLDDKDEETEFGEIKMDGVDGMDGHKIKKEKESDTDSIGASNSLDLEADPLKLDDSLMKSANSSANSSPSGIAQKFKVARVARGISPGGVLKQKVSIDMSNPLYREPFKYGWKRELVFRAGSEHAVKRMADIYYYTPKGKKVRSFREVAEYYWHPSFCAASRKTGSALLVNTKELTIDNFTFFKEPLGVNNLDFEIIRDARVRESTGPVPTPPKKVAAQKKTPVAKKIVEKPLTPPPVAKVTGKSPKVTPAGFKVKVPAKKGQQKKEVTKSPPKEPEMLPPQWNSPPTTRRSQPVVEKPPPPPKTKRVLKAKLQEPCSIRCSTSMGLIPSLQCHVCLCLYHPECVGDVNVAGSDYVCKNCHEDSSKSQQHQQVGSVPPPPPLIPISMIGTQSAKAITAAGNPPPKLQRIPKSEGTETATSRAAGKPSKSSNSPRSSPGPEKSSDGSWLQSGNEFLHSHDGTIPKPAQNIALMAGKRYIVVPKNNAMAVQPAVTVKSEKIGDKAPVLPEASTSDMPAEDSSLRLSPVATNDVAKPVDNETAKDSQTAEIVTPIETITELDESMNDRPSVETSESNETTEDRPVDNSRTEIPEITTYESENSKLVSTEVTGEPNSEVPTVPAETEAANEPPQIIVANSNNSDAKAVEDSSESIKMESVTANSSSVPSETIATNSGSVTLETAAADAPAAANSENIPAQTVATNAASVSPETVSTSSASAPSEPVGTISDNVPSETVATSDVTLQPANKKKLVPLETDQRHFMVSVCAGYHALSRIFQYLKVQELLRAARVCKMWRDLAAHPNLWKTVRMKNSQVTDWDGLADSLKRHGTQHLDLRKMLVAGESDGIWKKFVTVIPRVTSLVKLELCRCPVMVVEEVIKSCPQLEILSAMSIKCDSLNLESVGNLKSCQELRLKAISGMSLQGDLSPLQELTQLTHLSLTSVKELGKKRIDILASLINLETLELGECSDFPDKFGTSVLLKLEKLERLRLEKGQGTCCTFDILEGVSKLETLNQLELVNFDVKNGFDKCLSNCKNIKRLLIIPTYISQSATSNNMVLGGVTELSNNLTHFVWGVTLELLRVTELFVDQCNQMNKQVTGDSIPVLKPVPCLKLIEDVDEDNDPLKADEKPQPNLTNPQVDILPLPQLQKLLLTALPKTRVKILKIPFHATWRQSISDTTTQ